MAIIHFNKYDNKNNFFKIFLVISKIRAMLIDCAITVLNAIKTKLNAVSILVQTKPG